METIVGFWIAAQLPRLCTVDKSLGANAASYFSKNLLDVADFLLDSSAKLLIRPFGCEIRVATFSFTLPFRSCTPPSILSSCCLSSR